MMHYRAFVNTPDADKVPDDAYNVWREYRVHQIKTWDRAEGRRIVIKYLDFVHKLLGSERRQTMFFLRWQAHPFQHPGSKPQVMACLLGPQGGGKTTVVEVSMHMMAQGGTLAVYTHVALQNGLWSMGWVTALVLAAGLVGWSRLTLGAHTPREVYAGYAVGVVSVWLTLF